MANRDEDAFLLSHAKAPLREVKRDAATAHAMQHNFILISHKPTWQASSSPTR